MKKIFYLVMLAAIIPVMANGCKSDSDNNSFPDKDNSKIIYVAPSGNDENNGELNFPLKTIDIALSLAKPGDTVMLREGTYHQRVVFPQSGLLDKWITLKAYKGEKAIIDGTGVSCYGWMGLIEIKDVKCIAIENLDICNYTNTSRNCDPEGIQIIGESRHITISNCNIYGIKNNAPGRDNPNQTGDYRSAHAILVLGNSNTPISNLTIQGCNIYDINTGTSETLTLAGNVAGFVIKKNKVYDVENIGIIVAGGDNLNPNGNKATNYARNGVIADNTVYNCTHTKSPDTWDANSYGAIGIYVCGGANTIIERNTVFGCDRGIGLVSESDLYATQGCIVRNNFVYNCYRTGIYMGDYLGYTNGGTKDCTVINNTVYFNNKVLGAFGEIEGEIRLTRNCFNNVIKNNIIYARPNDVFIHKYTESGKNNTIDYNLYYTTGVAKWIWNDAVYTDFDSWKSACAGDRNSTNGVDPQFINLQTPDLHISTASPARSSGEFISADINGDTDIDGKPRVVNSKISKGAQQ